MYNGQIKIKKLLEMSRSINSFNTISHFSLFHFHNNVSKQHNVTHIICLHYICYDKHGRHAPKLPVFCIFCSFLVPNQKQGTNGNTPFLKEFGG